MPRNRTPSTTALNIFLTNGTGVGPVDPARLHDWNHFVAHQNALNSRPGRTNNVR